MQGTRLHTSAIVLWWMERMKASLQSFGGKARIENVISISYFSLIFSIKAMLAHGWPSSMQFICSLIHLPRDFVVVVVGSGLDSHPPLSLQYRCVWVGQSNASVGSFWGKWSEGFNFAQFIECAPEVASLRTAGKTSPWSWRRRHFQDVTHSAPTPKEERTEPESAPCILWKMKPAQIILPIMGSVHYEPPRSCSHPGGGPKGMPVADYLDWANGGGEHLPTVAIPSLAKILCK